MHTTLPSFACSSVSAVDYTDDKLVDEQLKHDGESSHSEDNDGRNQNYDADMVSNFLGFFQYEILTYLKSL